MPVEALPPVLHAVARVLPLTYAVSLLEGIWNGDTWSAHVGDVAALAVVVCRLHGAFGEGVSLGVTRVARESGSVSRKLGSGARASQTEDFTCLK